MKLLIVLQAALTILLLSGCKVEITVPEGGRVVSESGNYQCLSGQVCAIDVYDLFFREKFSARPENGFEFLAWRKRPLGLCGGSKIPCLLDSSLGSGYPLFTEILESDNSFYLEPLFLSRNRDYLSFSRGLDNSDDAYAREALWPGTRVLDPHQWDKACWLDYWLLKAEFAVITEINWWGYYTVDDLRTGAYRQNFRITFYAAESGKVVATRRITVTPASTGRLVSSLFSSQYANRIIYSYHKLLSEPLHVPRGDVLFSIVQIDGATGKSDPNFIWHGHLSSPGRGDMWFLTDYGGWIKGSLASCRVEMLGYHSGYYSRP